MLTPFHRSPVHKSGGVSFERWFAHYDYATESEAAAADYRRYREGLALVAALFGEHRQGEVTSGNRQRPEPPQD